MLDLFLRQITDYKSGQQESKLFIDLQLKILHPTVRPKVKNLFIAGSLTKLQTQLGRMTSANRPIKLRPGALRFRRKNNQWPTLFGQSIATRSFKAALSSTI